MTPQVSSELPNGTSKTVKSLIFSPGCTSSVPSHQDKPTNTYI
jgi:hypothetical protein